MEKDARLVVDFCEFNEDDYEYFVKKCMLNKELSTILEKKIKGDSNIEIADTLNLSEATLYRKLKLLKKKIKKVL